MSKKRIHNLQFWELVKAEYQLSYLTKCSPYICFSSPHFQQEWTEHSSRLLIKSLAREFVNSTDEKDFRVQSNKATHSKLFINTSISKEYSGVDVRKRFIQYCINKFKEKEILSKGIPFL